MLPGALVQPAPASDGTLELHWNGQRWLLAPQAALPRLDHPQVAPVFGSGQPGWLGSDGFLYLSFGFRVQRMQPLPQP